MQQRIAWDERPHPPHWVFSNETSRYRIFVATELRQRARAYRLAAELYRQAGLVDRDSCLQLFCPYDTLPHTLTLLAEDQEGRDAATMTLVRDGPQGLPADEIFGEEVHRLRRRRCRLGEGVRLAIRTEDLFVEGLLHGMLSLLRLYGARVLGCTNLIVEVNPRHVSYYRRLFGMTLLGSERPCPRVKNAPARLLQWHLTRKASWSPPREGSAPLQAPGAGQDLPAAEEESVRLFQAVQAPLSETQLAFFSQGTGIPAEAPQPAEALAAGHG